MIYDDGDPYFIPFEELRTRPECAMRSASCEKTWVDAINDGIIGGFILAIFILAFSILGGK